MYANFPRVKLLGTTGTFRKGKNWIHQSIFTSTIDLAFESYTSRLTAKMGTNRRDVRTEMLFSFIKPAAAVVACVAPFVNLVRGFAL